MFDGPGLLVNLGLHSKLPSTRVILTIYLVSRASVDHNRLPRIYKPIVH